MRAISIHNTLLGQLERLPTDAVLATAARFSFASALLLFFWNSAWNKLDGIFPGSGAYASILPKAMEEVFYDHTQLGFHYDLIVFAGTYAEFILPLMIVLGLLTRLAGLGMIGFVIVMSIVDVTGHGLDAASIGSMFDRHATALIMDQRLFWMLMFLTLVLKGGGPLSVDRVLGLK